MDPATRRLRRFEPTGYWGGDVVGMTAVREAIAYRQAGLCMATIAWLQIMGLG